jgi:hypothetical protein
MDGTGTDPTVHRIEVVLDGRALEVVEMPVDERVRRLEIAWAHKLADGPHVLELRLLDPRAGEWIRVDDLIVYGVKPAAPRY